ncbi:hypothetical protein EVAR_25515_1 [Eumeta japonica]|uniref:Uncharacterized protein n=1 Tax=Eumeta variegata TaxID=151549 RepID=A0A4C1VM50_EUMVA|nr:hypothetical protein EVAR_25515_1 [Eumeta japonica]
MNDSIKKRAMKVNISKIQVMVLERSGSIIEYEGEKELNRFEKYVRHLIGFEMTRSMASTTTALMVCLVSKTSKRVMNRIVKTASTMPGHRD